MVVDTHAHLFGPDFQSDLDDVLKRACDAGVSRIVVPGTDVETSRAAVELADRIPWVFACVGIHPHEAGKSSDEQLAIIEDLSAHPKVVAIGEIGLDYHYDFSPHDRQCALFTAQIDIAVRRHKPVVVHTRKSMADALQAVTDAVLRHPEWRAAADDSAGNEGPRCGVFHCFPGTADEASRLWELGFFVSYPGIVTFKKSNALNILRTIGFERILLETDSPYLAPVPLRGKRNEPANIVHIVRCIAEAFGVAEQAVAQATTRNAEILFDMTEQMKGNGS